MKRILAMVVCVAILATVAITGSIAYFTDSDSATNVFTVGNVVIKQYEQKRNNDKLEPFDDKTLGSLHPMVEKTGVGSDYVNWSFKKTDTETAGTSIQLRDLTHWANYVDKIVTVKNTGKSDAYVRNIVAIPTGLPAKAADVDWLVVDWYNAETKTNSDWEIPTDTNGNLIKDIDIGGVLYDIYVIYYGENGNGKLASGATTLPTLLGIGLSEYLDYDEVKGYYFLKDGKETPVDFKPESLKIYVATQAVQAAGFDTAEEAFKETFGAISANKHPWKDDITASGNYGVVDDETYSLEKLIEKGYVTIETIEGVKTLTGISPKLTELHISGDKVEAVGKGSSLVQAGAELNSLTIGDGVKRIADSAFKDFTTLATIKLPSTSIELGQYAFRNTGITSITIPKNVKFDEPKDNLNPDCGQFRDCKSLATVIFESGATKVAASLFYECEKLNSVTLPDTIEEIGNNAFCGCSSLGTIDIPSKVTVIGMGAFKSCTSLTSVTLHEGLKTIGTFAFMQCSMLNNVVVPKSVETINSCAFMNCTGLTEIKLPASFKGNLTDQPLKGIFDGCSIENINISYHS